MNNQLNQIFTITGFFSLALAATLAISWGMSQLLFQEQSYDSLSVKTSLLKHVDKNLDLKKSFELLIPKI